MGDRISRDTMFMDIAKTLAKRSTCNRAKVGALVVQGKRIVSTGYGGAPAGAPHCLDVGCEIGPDGGCIRTIHAEVNAIAFAASHGIALDGAKMYVTLQPCYNCAKLIINAGISEVVYLEPYRDNRGMTLLHSCDVQTFWLKEG